ncbi:MAG: SRPBCC family protein [Planctomycetes bacterium]|nr:SRPBCC family protein [Planctomycetota bacterium]
MGSFVLSKRIARNADDVFATLTDPANQRALFSGTTRSDSSPPGALRAGSVLKRTRTVGGTTVDGEVTVDVFRPGKELSLRGEAKGLKLEQRWRLVTRTAAQAPAAPPPAAETTVEYECRIEGSGFAALFAGAVLDAVRSADADHLERLSTLLEK